MGTFTSSTYKASIHLNDQDCTANDKVDISTLSPCQHDPTLASKTASAEVKRQLTVLSRLNDELIYTDSNNAGSGYFPCRFILSVFSRRNFPAMYFLRWSFSAAFSPQSFSTIFLHPPLFFPSFISNKEFYQTKLNLVKPNQKPNYLKANVD